jgi:HD-GYP domain-containing protein (c-di-GMP phosphodiesterase class II)
MYGPLEACLQLLPLLNDKNKPGDEDRRVFIPIEWLQPGCRVDCDVFSGTTRLLAEGTPVTSGMLIALKNRNIIQIEVKPGSALALAPALPPGIEAGTRYYSSLQQDADQIYHEHGIATAVDPQLLEEGTDLVEELFTSCRASGSLDIAQVQPLVRELVAQYTGNSDKPVKLLDLDRFDRYTYRHAVNVALLYITIAKDWCILREQLEELVLAAMLHDIGKVRIDLAIIDKRGALTDEEWEIVCQHPAWGAEIIQQKLPGGPGLSIVYSHHERLDGSGYPDRLLGFAIDQHARLAAVCDVYDALTTTRSYKGKLDFSRAIDILVHGAGTLFDPALVHQFIRHTGRFPVGTFVQLSSGYVGVVKRVNTDALWRPMVALVLNCAGDFLAPGADLDLRRHEELFITGIISNTEELK